MVSEEIKDRIDASQFYEEEQYEEASDSDEQIIIRLESDDVLIPGFIEKYMYRIVGNDLLSDGEELTFSFLTATKNITLFQRNIRNFKVAKLYYGEELIGDYNIEPLEPTKVLVEQTPGKAGCVITIVYR